MNFKRVSIFVFLLSTAAVSKANEKLNVHVLESPIIKIIDGSSIGIDGESIHMMIKYNHDLEKLLKGERLRDGSYRGRYSYKGQTVSIEDLAVIEAKEGSNPQLKKLLAQMRSDFEKISAQFIDAVKNFKSTVESLIKESCQKRGRLEGDTVLLEWAKPGNKDEQKIFEEHIKTIQVFRSFMVDITNFLNDFIASCPKARAQYEEQKQEYIAKFKLAQAIIKANYKTPEEQRNAFKKVAPFLKGLSKEDITLENLKKHLK